MPDEWRNIDGKTLAELKAELSGVPLPEPPWWAQELGPGVSRCPVDPDVPNVVHR